MTEDCEIDSARAAADTEPRSAAATKYWICRKVKAMAGSVALQRQRAKRVLRRGCPVRAVAPPLGLRIAPPPGA